MRDYSREFRMQVVRRILDGEKVPALSQELGIHRKLIYEWMRRVNEGGESNLRERGRPRKVDTIGGTSGGAPRQIADLERMLAHQRLVIDFFREVLHRVEELRPSRGVGPQEKRDFREGIFQAIETMTNRQGGLSVETMCELARVARSGYYRYLRSRGVEASACTTDR
jgi:transposase-like protein